MFCVGGGYAGGKAAGYRAYDEFYSWGYGGDGGNGGYILSKHLPISPGEIINISIGSQSGDTAIKCISENANSSSGISAAGGKGGICWAYDGGRYTPPRYATDGVLGGTFDGTNYAGSGGGGCAYQPTSGRYVDPGKGGPGGGGGGGSNNAPSNGAPGGANTGGGGGGGGCTFNNVKGNGGSGGSGIAIIRWGY